MSNSPCFGHSQCFVEPAGLGGHRVAEVGEHVVQQQADHRLVLDHEDALACASFCVGCHCYPVCTTCRDNWEEVRRSAE